MQKNADAFRTISEVADDLSLPQHVLRFWETRFPQIRPLKRAGGRRYYRPNDVSLLRNIRQLLYDDGYTIKGVQKLLKEHGVKGLGAGDRPFELAEAAADPHSAAEAIDALAVEPTADEVGADGHTALNDAHRADLEQALATIEDCRRLLEAVR